MVNPDEIKKLMDHLEEVGEEQVRLGLERGTVYNKWKSAYLRVELEKRQRLRSDDSQSEQIEIARSAKDAAWAAADAAREANQHAKQANVIAAIALVVAIIAIIVSGFLSWKTLSGDPVLESSSPAPRATCPEALCSPSADYPASA